MENEKILKQKEREVREPVFVLIRRKEAAKEENDLQEPREQTWGPPRRWHVY